MIKHEFGTWSGWRQNPCSEDTTNYLNDGVTRLEWAKTVDNSIKVGQTFGHAGNILETLNRADKIRSLSEEIKQIQLARHQAGC